MDLDKELETIRTWPYTRGWLELMHHLQQLWRWPEYFRENAPDNPGGPVRFEVSTGGWSEHEDIIAALQANWRFWGLCWVESRRGGHYIFEVRQPIEKPQ